MPARTVVIDSLSKFNGESHELLQPSDYTQLTGRAGRRGIDTEGTAVVLFSPYVPFDQVATIAAKGSNPLRSSFSPTYNMAVNLISRYDRETAFELLEASFANFSTAQRTEQLREHLGDRRSDLSTFREAAACELGDIWSIEDPGVAHASRRPDTSLLQPGVVLDISGEALVLIGRSWGGEQPKLSLTDVSGKRTMIRTRDLPTSVNVLGDFTLPSPQRPQSAEYRREVGTMLETFVGEDDPEPLFRTDTAGGVLACPDVDTHLKWAERSRRAERDIRRLERRLERSTTNNIRTEFNRLMKVLNVTRYTTDWSLTDRGESLRRLYNELDLLLAESLRTGVFSDLSASEFAALASIFTYEARGGQVSEMPRVAFAAHAIDAVSELAELIADHERKAGLVEGRHPDVGLVDSIYAWASGLELGEIFDADDLRAGDFVRSTRQLLDLLRQIRDGFPVHTVVAAEAIALLDRGIVESGMVR
jgi:ATP-dependent RNA helicase HelY